MEWVLFWLMFAIVVGIIANSRNRSGIGWFFLSVLITPILGLILVMCLPQPPPEEGATDAWNITGIGRRR